MIGLKATHRSPGGIVRIALGPLPSAAVSATCSGQPREGQMGWAELILAMTLFLATHFLPAQGPVRARLVRALGAPAYFALYGTISTLTLVWILAAAARAPHVELLAPAPWQRWGANLAMPAAFLCLGLGLGFRYPYTLFGRRRSTFDPDEPGLAAITRHPALWALAIWAAAHALANPDLAHLIAFGLFLVISVAAFGLFDRRARAAEPARWPGIQDATALLSLRPLGQAGWLRRNRKGLLVRILLGLALYAAMLGLHPWLIGVSPLP